MNTMQSKSLLLNQTLDEYCLEYFSRYGCDAHPHYGPQRECPDCWTKLMANLRAMAENSWDSVHRAWRDAR